jgi:2-polyprenyl-3-methyl-5-hydroxy-6-metoxy-1,4-benzoquinol methylase
VGEHERDRYEMNSQEIRDEQLVITENYGPWTAHNFSLGRDVFTIKDAVQGDEVKLRRILQMVSDICRRPINELRVLDLACLEGLFSIELGKRGAHVCAIEGRKENLEKARFAARTLSLCNVEFHQDDVRNLSEVKYGRFDVVLCLGILYHLDAPDVFTFLENVFAVCQHFVVIDTHISLYPEQTIFHKGKKYWGKTVPEHAPDASHEEKQKRLWASLDNLSSVYFTRPSLYSLLYDLGFTSVYECHIPQEPQKPKDRATFLAIKGTIAPPASCPQLPSGYARDLPEESKLQTSFHSLISRPSIRAVSRFLPSRFKKSLKQVLFFKETN